MSVAARAQPAALDQPFDSDSLYAVRAAVAAHASEAGFPEGRIRDVVLAVHELAANAVRHGAGQGRVQLWVTGDGIRCEVTDAGAPPAGANGDRPDASSRDAAHWPVEHGHGLWLVGKVADRASLVSGPSGTIAVVNFAFASHRRRDIDHRLRDIVRCTARIGCHQAHEGGTDADGLGDREPAVRFAVRRAGVAQQEL